MDANIIYTKTGRGLRAIIRKLPRYPGQVLSIIDKGISGEEISSKLSDVKEKDLEEAVVWLLEGGFIKGTEIDPFSNTQWDVSDEGAIEVDEIDIDQFTVSEKPPITIPEQAPVRKKSQAELEAEAVEQARILAQKQLLEKADKEAQERAEAALKAKLEAETKVKVEKEAEARRKAEEKAAAEEKARLEAEKAKQAAKEKAEKEAREKAEAEAKAKAIAEENARKEAEARRKAEEKAAAEEKARLEKEEKAKQAAKEKAEKEAREKEKAEAKARAKAEAKAEKEERAKRKAEEKAAAEEKARLEKEEKAKQAAREKAEKEAREKEEAAAKEKARAEAQEKAHIEALDRAEAKAIVEVEAEKKSLEKAAAREQQRLEALAKKEEKAQLKAELKAKAQIRRQRIISQLLTFGPSKQWLMNIGKSIKPISLFALAVLFLLIIAAQFINMRILINPIEEIATKTIQDEVNIKTVNISLFPKPHFLLGDITIADSKTINAKNIRIYPDLLNLKDKIFNQSNTPYAIQSVDLEGFNIAQKDIPRIVSWAGASSRNQQLKIKKITLSKLSINLNVIQLPYFDGEIILDNAGLMQEAKFNNDKQNLNIRIVKSSSQYLLNIEGIRWRSPMSPHPILTKLNAEGSVDDNVLTLHSITSDLYNGSLTGQLEMQLSSPALASKGSFDIKNFYIGDMAKELQLDTPVDGKLNIEGQYSFTINKPLNTVEMGALNAKFDIKNGQLKKVNIAEAMRSGNLSGVTDFSNLTGEISLNNQEYILDKLLLKDNQLTASGRVKIASNQQVSGDIASSISLKSNTIRARLLIEGPFTALRLKK